MPKLAKEDATLLMHSTNKRLLSLNLLFTPDTRNTVITVRANKTND